MSGLFSAERRQNFRKVFYGVYELAFYVYLSDNVGSFNQVKI